ncbi:MAG TPA: hypothetical protein VK524_16435 [Polyangiaceae bacterium]|nr:hypothetical protein [Polyangiaceae bacterium]
MRRLIAASVLVFACGFACSSDGDDSSIALDDAATVLADAACGALERCYGPLYDLVLPGEDCTTTIGEQLTEAVAELERAIDDGKARYDGGRMADCVDEVRAAGCGIDTALTSSACLAALDGTVELGDGCQSSQECSGDAFCRSAGTCPGQCVATGDVGAVCESDGECEAGLECSSQQRCYAPAKKGQACGGSAPETCDDGSFCVGASELGSGGECSAPDELFAAQSGESCSFVDGPLCAPGLSCTILSFANGIVEAECAPKVGAGAACTLAVPDQCPTEQYCAIDEPPFTGTCTPKPRAGQPCAPGPFEDSDPVCAPYLRCDGGTCRPLQPLGGSCESDSACRSEFCLRGTCSLEGACG